MELLEKNRSNSTISKNKESSSSSINMGCCTDSKKVCGKYTFNYVWSYFTISGVERVERPKLSAKDFELPDEVKPFQVAEYKPEIVAEYWNDMYRGQPWFRRIIKSFTKGLLSKCLPTIFLYLFVYYIFNFFFAQWIMCTPCTHNPLQKRRS